MQGIKIRLSAEKSLPEGFRNSTAWNALCFVMSLTTSKASVLWKRQMPDFIV